jgi:hypothetical protein
MPYERRAPNDSHNKTFAKQETALTKVVLATGDRIGALPQSRRLYSVAQTISYAHTFGTGHDTAIILLRATSSTLDDGTFVKKLNRTISAIQRTAARK